MEIEISLSKYTPQLYYFPIINNEFKHKAPEQIASAVLFTTGTDNFLITAKHVFNNIQPNDIIIFLNGDSTVRLSGDIGFFVIQDRHDNLDIAILKLSIELSVGLKHCYSFLHYKNIDFSHEYADNNTYMLLGYINHQTKLKSKVFTAPPFVFLTKIKPLKKITELGLNNIENITLKYSRRQQSFLFDNVISFGPKDLTGLSGGGIWFCRADKGTPHLQYCSLVGIMTEQLRGTNRGIVVGTKIKFSLHILAQYFKITL